MATSTQLRAVGLLAAVDDACRRVERALDVPPTEAQRAAIRETLRALAWAGVQLAAPVADLMRDAHGAARAGARARLGSPGEVPTSAEYRRALAERIATAPAAEIHALARAAGLPLADA
jgi:hypothetical protein